MIEKKEALKREKEELKKSKKSVKPSRSADSDGDGSKRRKVIEDAEAVAAAQVAKWEEEDALLDKLLSENNDSDESPEDCEEEVDLLSRVPSLAEESAECELLSKVLKDFSEEDHMLLESMVTKARYNQNTSNTCCTVTLVSLLGISMKQATSTNCRISQYSRTGTTW